MTNQSGRPDWAALTHCRHGLDLRINPRCYLCLPARANDAGLREAARDAIVLLERMAFSIHYGTTLHDHQSVFPGDRIATCVDDPCPQTIAAVGALRSALRSKDERDA